MLGIVKTEGEAEQRRDRSERDVALVPGDAHAENFLALVGPTANDTEIGNRGRIRTGFRAGEREAGDFEALGEARQVIVLLRVGAVMEQQLGRPRVSWAPSR